MGDPGKKRYYGEVLRILTQASGKEDTATQNRVLASFGHRVLDYLLDGAREGTRTTGLFLPAPPVIPPRFGKHQSKEIPWHLLRCARSTPAFRIPPTMEGFEPAFDQLATFVRGAYNLVEAASIASAWAKSGDIWGAISGVKGVRIGPALSYLRGLDEEDVSRYEALMEKEDPSAPQTAIIKLFKEVQGTPDYEAKQIEDLLGDKTKRDFLMSIAKCFMDEKPIGPVVMDTLKGLQGQESINVHDYKRSIGSVDEDELKGKEKTTLQFRGLVVNALLFRDDKSRTLLSEILLGPIKAKEGSISKVSGLLKYAEFSFLVLPVSIFVKDEETGKLDRSVGHANAIIFDKEKKRVVMFDPHVSYSDFNWDAEGHHGRQHKDILKILKDQEGSPLLVDVNVKGRVEGHDGWVVERIGKQDAGYVLQQQDSYCQSWTPFLVSLYLLNPHLTMPEILSCLSMPQYELMRFLAATHNRYTRGNYALPAGSLWDTLVTLEKGEYENAWLGESMGEPVLLLRKRETERGMKGLDTFEDRALPVWDKAVLTSGANKPYCGEEGGGALYLRQEKFEAPILCFQVGKPLTAFKSGLPPRVITLFGVQTETPQLSTEESILSKLGVLTRVKPYISTSSTHDMPPVVSRPTILSSGNKEIPSVRVPIMSAATAAFPKESIEHRLNKLYHKRFTLFKDHLEREGKYIRIQEAIEQLESDLKDLTARRDALSDATERSTLNTEISELKAKCVKMTTEIKKLSEDNDALRKEIKEVEKGEIDKLEEIKKTGITPNQSFRKIFFEGGRHELDGKTLNMDALEPDEAAYKGVIESKTLQGLLIGIQAADGVN